MVGRALIAERRGDRGMNFERVMRESQLELRQRAGPFVAAMAHRDQIGDGHMAFAVGAVWYGRYRCGIGGPHR